MKKNLRFQQIQVISNSGISKYLLFHIFLCERITLGIDSICIIFEDTAHVHASKLVIFSLDKKMGGCSIIPYLVFDITPSISSIPAVTLGTTTSRTTFRFMNDHSRGTLRHQS